MPTTTVDAPAWVPDEPRYREGGPGCRRSALIPDAPAASLWAPWRALAVLITVFTLIRSNPPPVASAKFPPVDMVSSAAPRPGTHRTGPANSADQSVVVSVVGLVQQPGLVTLAPGARIADAVSAAGGPLKGADTVGLNLARHVVDGEQIVVGIATPAGHAGGAGQFGRTGSPATGNVGPAAASVAGPTPSRAGRPEHRHCRATGRPARRRTGDRSGDRRLAAGQRQVQPASTNSVRSTASVRPGWRNCGRWCGSDMVHSRRRPGWMCGWCRRRSPPGRSPPPESAWGVGLVIAVMCAAAGNRDEWLDLAPTRVPGAWCCALPGPACSASRSSVPGSGSRSRYAAMPWITIRSGSGSARRLR